VLIEVVVAAIMCALALGGVIRGLFKWLAGIERLTLATERLTAAFNSHAEKTGNQLADHEHRITVLETRGE
jgi:hypothetical protein